MVPSAGFLLIIITVFAIAQGIANAEWSLETIMQKSLPPAQARPSVNITSLVENCKAPASTVSLLSADNRSPRYGLEVYLELSVDRFVGINDVAETATVTGSLQAIWGARCNDTQVEVKDLRDRVMVPKVGEIYRPAIGFRSSVDDIAMQSELFYDRMEVYYELVSKTTTDGVPYTVPDLTAKVHDIELIFYWKRRGIFTSVCNLNLARFPFDTQTCDFNFNLIESVTLVNFTRANLTNNLVDSYVDIWKYRDGTWNFSTQQPDLEDHVSQVTFQLRFQRQPMYFISNLLAPCLVLNFLELVAFLIPPENSDRLCFSVYLVLAFAVGQTQVLASIPQTPQHVLLNDYIQLLALVCVFCTVHAIVMFWFVTTFSRAAKRPLFCNLRLSTIVDIAVFTTALILLFGANYYAMNVAGYM